MTSPSVTCPVCRYQTEAATCPSCGESLASLLRLKASPSILFNRALELAREGQFEGARASLERARADTGAEVDPDLMVLLAKVLVQLGSEDEARVRLDEALTAAPDHAGARAAREALIARQETTAAQARTDAQASRRRRWLVIGAAFASGALLAAGIVVLARPPSVPGIAQGEPSVVPTAPQTVSQAAAQTAATTTTAVTAPTNAPAVAAGASPTSAPDAVAPAPTTTNTQPAASPAVAAATTVPNTVPPIAVAPTITTTAGPAASPPPAVLADPEARLERVASALGQRPELVTDLAVSDQGGVVHLTGRVRSLPDRLEAEKVARSAADGAPIDPGGLALDEGYVVQPGDTLTTIAVRLYGDGDPARVRTLREANKIPNENAINVGQRLIVPSP